MRICLISSIANMEIVDKELSITLSWGVPAEAQSSMLDVRQISSMSGGPLLTPTHYLLHMDREMMSSFLRRSWAEKSIEWAVWTRR